MVIKEKQIIAFSRSLVDRFIKESITHLLKKYPDQVKEIPRNALKNMIEEGIDKASKYKITEEANVLVIIEYILCLGQNFDQSPLNARAKQVLEKKYIAEDIKIKRLVEQCPIISKEN